MKKRVYLEDLIDQYFKGTVLKDLSFENKRVGVTVGVGWGGGGWKSPWG